MRTHEPNHWHSRFRPALRRLAIVTLLGLRDPRAGGRHEGRPLGAGCRPAGDGATAFREGRLAGLRRGRAGVGLVQLRKRDYVKAKEAFELSQRMDANLATSWFGLGEAQRNQGNCAGAIENYCKAVDLDRKFPEAQLALGDCLREQKQTPSAPTALAPGLNWGPKRRHLFLAAHGNVDSWRAIRCAMPASTSRRRSRRRRTTRDEPRAGRLLPLAQHRLARDPVLPAGGRAGHLRRGTSPRRAWCSTSTSATMTRSSSSGGSSTRRPVRARTLLARQALLPLRRRGRPPLRGGPAASREVHGAHAHGRARLGVPGRRRTTSS